MSQHDGNTMVKSTAEARVKVLLDSGAGEEAGVAAEEAPGEEAEADNTTDEDEAPMSTRGTLPGRHLDSSTTDESLPLADQPAAATS